MKEQELPEPFTGTVCAAGGVVFQDQDGERQWLIVHRPRYDDWSLPKGKLERGETWSEAALREVQEETDIRCELIEFADAVAYHHGDHPKVVAYYRMRILEAIAFEANEEVDEILWLPLPHAVAKLSYPTERDLLQKLAEAQQQ